MLLGREEAERMIYGMAPILLKQDLKVNLGESKKAEYECLSVKKNHILQERSGLCGGCVGTLHHRDGRELP